MVMVKEVYAVYKKRYKQLPSFDELNNEFELYLIETPDFFLRQVKNKIKEKLQDLADTFADILNPSSESLVHLSECKIFEADEKDKIYELFRQIQYYLRAIYESCYLNKEALDAELIGEIHKEWATIKANALVYLSKLKEHWKRETNLKEALEYFG